MKLTQSTLITAALMVPFAGAQALPLGLDVQTAEASVAEALMNLTDVVSRGDVRPADLDGIGDAMDDWFDVTAPTFPNSKPIREGLEIYLEELLQRAQNAYVSRRQVHFLKEQIVEAQLEAVLQELIFRARNNNWTPSHFQRVRAKLIARANAAVDAPSSAYLRQRFEELAAEATVRAQNAFAKKVEEYRIEVIEFRLDNALRKLRMQRNRGQLSPIGFQRMVTLLHRQARAAARG